MILFPSFFFFFFNDTATTEIYTLSLHDALPIFIPILVAGLGRSLYGVWEMLGRLVGYLRSEEHTSELQSRFDLVCRLLLEKKKEKKKKEHYSQQGNFQPNKDITRTDDAPFYKH